VILSMRLRPHPESKPPSYHGSRESRRYRQRQKLLGQALTLTRTPYPTAQDKPGEISRAQIEWHVAADAAQLIGSSTALFDRLPEHERTVSQKVANGRSRDDHNAAMRDLMRKRRAAAKADKAKATQ
jgi:hypothetical protein